MNIDTSLTLVWCYDFVQYSLIGIKTTRKNINITTTWLKKRIIPTKNITIIIIHTFMFWFYPNECRHNSFFWRDEMTSYIKIPLYVLKRTFTHKHCLNDFVFFFILGFMRINAEKDMALARLFNRTKCCLIL